MRIEYTSAHNCVLTDGGNSMQFIDYKTSQTLDCVDSAQLIAELQERLKHSNVGDVLYEELVELASLIDKETSPRLML